MITDPQSTNYYWPQKMITDPKSTNYYWPQEMITDPKITKYYWPQEMITDPIMKFSIQNKFLNWKYHNHETFDNYQIYEFQFEIKV